MNANGKIEISANWRGYGWADFSISASEKSVDLPSISYLCDPLGEFVRAALDCAIGRPHASVVLQQEPGAYSVQIDRCEHSLDEPIEDDQGPIWAYHTRCLRVIDLGREELFPLKGASGQVLLEYGTRDLDAFSAAVLAFVDKIIAEHGVKGWRALWAPDCVAFPERGVAALRAAMATTDEDVEW